MALPNVRIILQNGALGGLVAFAEGVAALIATGVAVASKIAVGDPKLIFNLQEAVDLGIDATNNPLVYNQVKEFYSTAGTGAELYIMLVPDTMKQSEMWDITNANGIVKLLDFAQGRVRIATSHFKPAGGYTLDVTAGIEADTIVAITKAHELCQAYAENQTPLRALLQGHDCSDVTANFSNLKAMTKNRVAVALASVADLATPSVGLVLGRLAAVPPQRKISRVKDGSLPITTAKVGTKLVTAHTGLDLLHDKGYIVMRTFPGLSGLYFSGDPTCSPSTDDYNMIARGRVIDKAQVIAYATYVEELDDEVLVDATGKLDLGKVKYLETKIANQINGSMTANGEISGVTIFIDPAQDILSTNKLKVVMKLRPVGYNSDIEVALGFDNPNT